MHDAKKFRLNRRTKRILLDCYCSSGADRLHVAELPTSEDANAIARASVDPKFDALILTDIVLAFDDPNHDRHTLYR